MTQPESKPPRSNELEKEAREFAPKIFPRLFNRGSIIDAGRDVSFNINELVELMAAFAAQVEERTITDLMKNHNAHIESAAERERERCCKDVCPECAKGDKAVRSPYADEANRSKHSAWIHTMLGFDDRTEDCRASAIRERSRG